MRIRVQIEVKRLGQVIVVGTIPDIIECSWMLAEIDEFCVNVPVHIWLNYV